MWSCIKQMSPEILTQRPKCLIQTISLNLMLQILPVTVIIILLGSTFLLFWYLQKLNHNKHSVSIVTSVVHKKSNVTHKRPLFHLLLPLLCSYSHPSYLLILSSPPLYRSTHVSWTLSKANTIPAKIDLI